MKTVIRIIPLMLVSAWFWNSGVAAQTLPEPKGAIQQLAYSPDGALIAVADDSAEVWLYDAHALTAVGVLQGHTRKVTAVAFSPDGRLLASAGQDKTVRLWEVSQRKAVGVLEGHTSDVTSVAFSPDGKVLASGSGDRTVRLWEVSQQQEMAVLKGHKSPVISVAFSPDGRLLASGSLDKTVRLWEVDQRQEVAVLNGHSGRANSVVFSPDGKSLASGSWDQTVRLWDVVQRQEVAVLNGHTDKVNSVVFSPNGKVLASGSADSTIRVWDLAQHTEIAVLRGHRDGVPSVVFSPDGTRLVSGGGDNDDTVRLWEVPSYREVASFRHRYAGYLLYAAIYSPALNATKPYAIYLPPSYEASDRRYPVIYVLHGTGGRFKERTVMRSAIDRMIRQRKIGEMIAVFPDGSSRGNAWITIGDYETYLTRDLVTHIDTTYRTIAHRNSRGITGFSRGGYVTMRLAVRFPEIFSIAVPQAGVYTGKFYGGSANNIMPDVDRYIRQPVRLNGIKVVHGKADDTVPINEARAFDKALTDLAIEHVYVEHGGGHIFIDEESLPFMSDHLAYEVPTAVLEDHTASLPQSFALNQNFPNPFNSSTVIRFELPQHGEVELAVYNLAGQQVAKLVEGVREAGAYTLRWDGKDESGHELASGVYLYRLRASGYVQTRKLLLLR